MRLNQTQIQNSEKIEYPLLFSISKTMPVEEMIEVIDMAICRLTSFEYDFVADEQEAMN